MIGTYESHKGSGKNTLTLLNDIFIQPETGVTFSDIQTCILGLFRPYFIFACEESF